MPLNRASNAAKSAKSKEIFKNKAKDKQDTLKLVIGRFLTIFCVLHQFVLDLYLFSTSLIKADAYYAKSKGKC